MRWEHDPSAWGEVDHLGADPRATVFRPPATGAWQDGDIVGCRRFAQVGSFTTEHGGVIPNLRVAYETFGTLDESRGNAVLVFHAFTGDSHIAGPAGNGHLTPGWWDALVGPSKAIDTDRFFVVCSNLLGGCQGTSGPASYDTNGHQFGPRFPRVSVRDQVRAQLLLADELGIDRFHTVIGGSMGGMLALEWALLAPERLERLAVLAAPPETDARTIAENTLQADAIRLDPEFRGGDYYDSVGPWRGLALARRLAMINYRAADEFGNRFGRSWQSERSPVTSDGRYAVESYLDFHGNRFTRRFDANSYLTLLEAMNSHDVGRDRGGVEAALATIACPTLVAGVPSDTLFPIETQYRIARGIQHSITGDEAFVIESPCGHDGFLVEDAILGPKLAELLALEI